MFHRYFRGRIQAYVVEMEKQAIALVDTLDGGARAPTAQAAAQAGAAGASAAPAAAPRRGA
jgi:biopolymer transport protein ExbB